LSKRNRYRQTARSLPSSHPALSPAGAAPQACDPAGGKNLTDPYHVVSAYNILQIIGFVSIIHPVEDIRHAPQKRFGLRRGMGGATDFNLKVSVACGIQQKIASYCLHKISLSYSKVCAENFVRHYFALFRLGPRNQLKLSG